MKSTLALLGFAIGACIAFDLLMPSDAQEPIELEPAWQALPDSVPAIEAQHTPNGNVWLDGVLIGRWENGEWLACIGGEWYEGWQPGPRIQATKPRYVNWAEMDSILALYVLPRRPAQDTPGIEWVDDSWPWWSSGPQPPPCVLPWQHGPPYYGVTVYDTLMSLGGDTLRIAVDRRW